MLVILYTTSISNTFRNQAQSITHYFANLIGHEGMALKEGTIMTPDQIVTPY